MKRRGTFVSIGSNRYLCLTGLTTALAIIVLLAAGTIIYAIETMTAEGLPDVNPEINSHDYTLTRMGNLTIRVQDASGKPAENAQVYLLQTGHEFWFGSAIADTILKLDYQNDPIIVDTYEDIFTHFFNSAVHENALNWYTTEYHQGSINYSDADKWLKWCEENNIPVRGHMLFWEKEQWNLNEWLKSTPRDSLRKAVEKRAKEVTTRYQGRILEYEVVNETLHGNFFRGRLGDDIIGQMFRWAHEADPQAVLYINDYISGSADLLRYEETIQSLLDDGVPLGGIGIQAHFGDGPDRIPPPTPQEWQELLDRLSRFNLPIQITEYGYDTTDEAKKASYLEDFYLTCFSHPSVKGIVMWGFWEGAIWRPGAAIFDQNFQPKPAAEAYYSLVFKKLRTYANGTTDSKGKFSTRAFYGNYHLAAAGTDGMQGYLKVKFSSKSSSPADFTIMLDQPPGM